MCPLNIQDENWSFKCTRKICSESSKIKSYTFWKTDLIKVGRLILPLQVGEELRVCSVASVASIVSLWDPSSCDSLWPHGLSSPEEYWSGLPFPSPGDLPDPRTEPASLALQADSLPLSYLLPNTLVSTWSQKEERKVTSEHREGRGRETGWDRSSAGRAWREQQKPELSARGHRASSDRDKT